MDTQLIIIIAITSAILILALVFFVNVESSGLARLLLDFLNQHMVL